MRSSAYLWAVLFVSLALITIWVASPSQAAETNMILDFSSGRRVQAGDLPAGTHDLSFEVRNVSKDVVQIEKVSGSCTCMDIVFDGKDLMPGESRTCTVELIVKPGAKLSSSVIFHMTRPTSKRDAVSISYRGIQEDHLEFGQIPESIELHPDQQLEFTMSCTWEMFGEGGEAAPSGALSEGVETLLPLLHWRIKDSSGVQLLESEEVRVTPTSITSVASFRVDARGLERAFASIEVQAGVPTRAQATQAVSFPVVPSIRLALKNLLVSDREQLDGRLLARVAVHKAIGWSVAGVSAPEWLSVELSHDELLITSVGAPDEDRGVYFLTLSCVSAEGREVLRTIRVVVDLEEEQQ